MKAFRYCATFALLACSVAAASPDEDRLGKAQGYPLAPSAARIHEAQYIVGAFSGMDRISPSCDLAPADQPVQFKIADKEADVRYRFRNHDYTLADYMEHQRATAVLIVQDGVILAEHYGYDRTQDMRMLSNSMAKTLVALAIGKALEDGSLRSLDDRVDQYVPELAGTLYGGTRIVDLLRMASGAKYVEDYTPTDDRARFLKTAAKQGVLAAAAQVNERADAPGTRFNYAGAQTEVLALVLQAATHRSLCDFVDDKLWKPMGAEAKATYLLRQSDGSAFAQGGFNATARDYARLGSMLANDGVVQGRQVVPRDFLLDMTDAARQPDAFRPGQMTYRGSRYYGYGFQVWLLPGQARRFVLLGIHGQAIYVEPQSRLTMVHLAVGQDASGDASGAHLGAERDALWRGVVEKFGR
ncbi:serine hydrolase [Ralstonia pickettii]|uniref:Serine hydrolase n=1 Tax=Ralstonia pickettii TaxID=329 RepID=A0A2N4TL59_RALPI|nr:serine hydrolase [Ralstonia pickettii]PLC40442.1 serine hydrolase [Ralstonia pickettii]